MAESSVNNPQLIPPNPTTKFYTNFLYKAILVSIFLLLLPLFPSQAPDFINHTINTTSWELLQLVLVGIAVSYGLFSKRNDDDDDTHKDINNNTHSYVAGLLQVSSVFDDDSENPSASASASDHNNTNNVHTWNSQYYRGEPIVVVAKESDDATTIEKPLLLPVRSLKNESNSFFSRSNSRRLTRNYSKLTPGESEEENIVLRSPIPWRSRSGRMEVKEDFSQTPSVHPIESSSPSPSFKRAYQSSKGVSSEEINPSSEAESKSLEDVGWRKKSPNPPPPPPPPPPPVSAYGQVKVNYNNNNNNSGGKELRRSVRSIPEKLENRRRRSQRGGEELMTIRSRSDIMSTREKERESECECELLYLSHDKEIERFIERRGSQMMEEETGKDSEEEEELQEVASRKNNKNSSSNGEEEEKGGGGPDVDKKADEFIAKFREQIRLQRIASIRRSTAPQTQTQTGSYHSR